MSIGLSWQRLITALPIFGDAELYSIADRTGEHAGRGKAARHESDQPNFTPPGSAGASIFCSSRLPTGPRMLGRILAVQIPSILCGVWKVHLHREGRKDWQRQRTFPKRPMTASRWAHPFPGLGRVWATYADRRTFVAERGWDHDRHGQALRGRDGEEHLYSSKPPLFATLMAGPYWLINRTTGATSGRSAL